MAFLLVLLGARSIGQGYHNLQGTAGCWATGPIGHGSTLQGTLRCA